MSKTILDAICKGVLIGTCGYCAFSLGYFCDKLRITAKDSPADKKVKMGLYAAFAAGMIAVIIEMCFVR